MNHKISFLGGIFLFILISSVNATIYNCRSCEECESAISNASAGDTVNLLTDIRNHSGTCILWNNSNVTFDCREQGIDGMDAGYGIYMESAKGNVIKNCVITDFFDGIYLYYSDNNQIGDNTIESNHDNSIMVRNSAGNLLSGNTLKSNTGNGLKLDGSLSRNNTVINNLAGSNGGSGIAIYDCSSGNRLENNTANSNTVYGIEIYFDSNDNTLVNNTASYNENAGISIYNSEGSTLGENTVNNNTGYGVFLDYHSNSNTLANNIVNSNTVYGIYLYYSRSNTLSSNTVSNNSDHGIYLYNSSHNTLTGNNVNSNNYEGIYIYNSSYYNTLVNNTANSNDYSGIYLRDSSYNTLTNNTANSNQEQGIRLRFSSNNTLTNNTANLNTIDGIHLWDSLYNTITGNTANSNTVYGIYITYPSNSTLNSNQACYNLEDFHLYNSLGNSGDNNTCDIAVDWDDTGEDGCTYSCPGTTNLTTTTTSTSTTSTSLTTSTSTTSTSTSTTSTIIIPTDALTVERHLPETTTPGSEFAANLSIVLGDSPPTGVVIREYIPTATGWELVNSSPAYDIFDPITGGIKWMVYGGELRNRTISYTLQSPEEFDGIATFSGQFLYNINETHITENISGDDSINITEEISTIRPHIIVSRGDTTIDGNYLLLEFLLENDGYATAEDISIQTSARGFVPARESVYNYNSSNFSVGDYSSVVTLVLDSLGPQNSTSVYCSLVPVLGENDLDYEIDPTGFVDVIYHAIDGGEYYATFPTSATIPEQDVYSAISTADYLIATNPSRLYSHYPNLDVDRLLSVMSKLAKEENGVLGFVTNYSAESLERLIDSGWNNRMNPQWRDDGFLLLVGETEIIPSWDITFDCQGSFNISITATSSDNVYADILEGDSYAPELYLGRVIGNFVSDLENSILNSIYASYQRNNALIASGSGSGWESFLSNAIEVEDVLGEEFNVTRLYMGNYSTDGEKFSEFSAYTGNADLIYWRDHGSEQSWGTGFINTNNAADLNLSTHPPLVFSSACLTGHYQNTYSLAEAFLANDAGVFIGSTEVSYRTFNNEFSKRFFKEFMHSTERPLGKALREAKREFRSIGNGSCQLKALIGYTINEYNLYGDPKAGTTSIQPSQSIKTLAVEGSLSYLNVTVPNYTVREMLDEHWVEIPDGNMLLEPGAWQIPYYRVAIPYPPGYRIQSVELLSRTGLSEDTGLNIPEVSMEPGGIPAGDGRIPAGLEFNDGRIQPGQNPISPQSPGFYPTLDFGWDTLEYVNETTMLIISVYPFYYDSNTTDVRFYKNYSFSINYTISFVKIAGVNTDEEKYLRGESVDITIEVNNSKTPIDASVSADIKLYGSDEVVGSIALGAVTLNPGITESNLSWDTSGQSSGYYLTDIVLRDTNGLSLDSANKKFRLGVLSGDIIEFNVTPTNMTGGGNISINLNFSNTGTENLSGAALIILYNSSSDIVGQFSHSITKLGPGGTVKFSEIFSPSAPDTYEVVASVLYGSKSTEPETLMIKVNDCSLKGDGFPCDDLVTDFDLLHYIQKWSTGRVEDFELLEAINHWATG